MRYQILLDGKVWTMESYATYWDAFSIGIPKIEDLYPEWEGRLTVAERGPITDLNAVTDAGPSDGSLVRRVEK